MINVTSVKNIHFGIQIIKRLNYTNSTIIQNYQSGTLQYIFCWTYFAPTQKMTYGHFPILQVKKEPRCPFVHSGYEREPE
jgi:hypothetical protein